MSKGKHKKHAKSMPEAVNIPMNPDVTTDVELHEQDTVSVHDHVDILPKKDVVAYMHKRHPAETMQLFEILQEKGVVSPYKDEYTRDDITELERLILYTQQRMMAVATVAKEQLENDATPDQPEPQKVPENPLNDLINKIIENQKDINKKVDDLNAAHQEMMQTYHADSSDNKSDAEDNTHNIMEEKIMSKNVKTAKTAKNISKPQTAVDTMLTMIGNMNDAEQEEFMQIMMNLGNDVTADEDVSDADVMTEDTPAAAPVPAEGAHKYYTKEEVAAIVDQAVRVSNSVISNTDDKKSKAMNTLKKVGKYVAIGAAIGGAGYGAYKAYNYVQDRRAAKKELEAQAMELADGTEVMICGTGYTAESGINTQNTVGVSGTMAMVNGDTNL